MVWFNPSCQSKSSAWFLPPPRLFADLGRGCKSPVLYMLNLSSVWSPPRVWIGWKESPHHHGGAAPPLNNSCCVAGFPWSSPGGKWWNSTQSSSKRHAATMTTRLCERKSVESLQPILWNSTKQRMRVSIQPTENKRDVSVCWWVQQFNLTLIAHNLTNYPRAAHEYEHHICLLWDVAVIGNFDGPEIFILEEK